MTERNNKTPFVTYVPPKCDGKKGKYTLWYVLNWFTLIFSTKPTWIYQQCYNKWEKVFENNPSKICGRQPLKILKEYGLPTADHTPSKFLKTVFHNFFWSIL